MSVAGLERDGPTDVRRAGLAEQGFGGGAERGEPVFLHGVHRVIARAGSRRQLV